jgi:(2Fe-2S) ferredoxin
MEEIPYKCHVITCVNDRQGERQSCGNSGSLEIRMKLKEAVKEMGWLKKDVRVSQSGCLGMCKAGPIVMIYPQNILFSQVTLDDVPRILDQIKEIMEC